MRGENLPDWAHGKVTWKRSLRPINKASQQRNSETWSRYITATLLSVSFGTYRGRCRDILWDVKNMYHRDVLVTYNWDVVGCFIWDLFETSRRRFDGTSLLRPLETSSRRSNKMSWRCTTETSWRRSTETSMGVSFERYLQRRWHVQTDVITTSLWRLVAGWDG